MNVAIYTQTPSMAASLGALLGQDTGLTVVEATSSPDNFYKTLNEGNIELAVTGIVTLDEFAEICQQLSPDTWSTTKRVLAVMTMNKEAIKSAAAYDFDGIVDVHNPPEAIARQLKNIVRNGAIAGHGPNSGLNDRLDAFPDFFINRDKHDQMIAELVARGMTDKQVSEAVGLAPQTVRNRLSRMLTDSGSQNRTHLAVRFLRERERHLRDS